MGVAALRTTTTHLLAAGRDPECPVAIVERGWLPDQRVTVGTVATIGDIADQVGVENPAVIVIGDVVTVSPHFPGA